MDISIVIPCLDESPTLKASIDMAMECIQLSGKSGEVLVVDNGSSDNSADIARKSGCRVVCEMTKGYGNALKKGIHSASGQFVIIGDADGTYDFREAVIFIKYLENGVDMVVGSRFRGKIAQNAMPFLHQHLGTPFLTCLLNLLFRTELTDINCGMRAFSKKSFENLGIESGGMEFCSEMIIKAKLYGLEIVEKPCSLHYCACKRTPHLNTWRDGFLHLRMILKLWVQQIPTYFCKNTDSSFSGKKQ